MSPTRIDKLTPEQEARMASWADEWIERGLDCTPVDRAAVEVGMEACYRYAGIPWHGRVIWADSPLVVSLAGPIAAEICERSAVNVAVNEAVNEAVGVAVRVAVDEAVNEAVNEAVRGAVGVAVRGAVGGAVDVAVDEAVNEAVGVAVGVAVNEAVRGAIGGAVGGAVNEAVRGAVGVAVRGAVGEAVGVAVGVAVSGAVDGAVGGAVDGAVNEAVGVAVRGAVGGAVDVAVNVAVDVAVGETVGVAVEQSIKDRWHRRLWGQTSSYWLAWRTFFRDVCDLELDGDMWHRSRAYEAANQAGWWWPHTDFIIVSERPKFIHREQVGPRGWGSHRLHAEDGPAIQWRDGWAIWSWHGVTVPQWVVESPTIEQIFAEDNAEIRRCAIESLGWDRLTEHLTLVGECDDPGNAPHTMCLYDLPDTLGDLYDGEQVRVLVATNGSPDRTGAQRKYGITVPADITDPLSAAAWTYGIDPTEYTQLSRRT